MLLHPRMSTTFKTTATLHHFFDRTPTYLEQNQEDYKRNFSPLLYNVTKKKRIGDYTFIYVWDGVAKSDDHPRSRRTLSTVE